MARVALMGLLRIDLPAATVRLCDGGFMVMDGDTYRSADDTFGSLGGIRALAEGVGDEVPALELSLLPPGSAAVGDLSQPGYQVSRVRLWIGEYDVDLGTLAGTADLMFDGQLDQSILSVGRNSRELALTVVSTAERLFNRNEGNALSPSWHKSVWPGETGHDEGTGLTIAVAWGVESPRSGVATGGGGLGSGGTWWNPRLANV